MDPVSRYEVRCESCRVSFPVGTKVCIHCGGRTGPSAADAPGGMFWTRSTESQAEPQQDDQQQEEEEEVRQSPVRVLVTLLWVALAIAFSVVRSCSES